MKLALILLAFSAPAFAETPRADLRSSFQQTQAAAVKWEIGYQVLNVIDTAQTIHCLHRDTCEEANPLFGKHPSSTKLIAAKLILGGAHYMLFSRLNEHNPKAALRVAQISFALQGTVIALNMRFTFK